MTKIKANQLEIREILNDPTAQASETWKGTLRIATQAEVNGGSPYDNTIVVTPETLANFSGLANNWVYANGGIDFVTVPKAAGTNSIAIGNNTTAADTSAIAIGNTINAFKINNVVIGSALSCNAVNSINVGTNNDINSAPGNQTVIGEQITPTSSSASIQYSVKLGYGAPTVDKNMLHLYSKGKLELYGDEAQFIFPNYTPTGSPATALPATTNQGGTIYDFDTKTLKFYNGTAWTELNSYNWLSANSGNNFTTTPIALSPNAIALGDNSQALAQHALAVGTNVTASVNSVSLGVDSDTFGSSSIAIGDSAQSGTGGEGATIAIGLNSSSVLGSQVSIGNGVTGASVSPTDVQFSTKIGYGVTGTDKNMLHLFSKGKLELYGESAQFIMPNYAAGSPSVLPTTATEGGVIYDSTAKGLQLYDGSSWSAVGGGGTPGGTDTQIQYNNGGAFGGAANFTYNDVTGTVTATGNVISHIAINAQIVTSYPLVLTDDGKLVTMDNGSANTLTIPTNASVAFPIGTQILVEQEGTGITTISGGTGSPPAVTINSAGGLVECATQYSTLTLIKKATDIWLLTGDLA